MAFEPSEKIGGLSEGELRPVWYEFEAERRSFLVVGRERAEWVRHLRAAPRIALHVADDLHAQRPRVPVRVVAERWRTWTGQEWPPRYWGRADALDRTDPKR